MSVVETIWLAKSSDQTFSFNYIPPLVIDQDAQVKSVKHGIS